jgi:hypothetical protein
MALEFTPERSYRECDSVQRVFHADAPEQASYLRLLFTLDAAGGTNVTNIRTALLNISLLPKFKIPTIRNQPGLPSRRFLG